MSILKYLKTVLKPIDLKIISYFHPWFLIFFIWMVSELFKYRFVEIFCVTGRFKIWKKWSLKCSFRRCDIINKFLILLISNLENIFKCIKPGLSLRLFQSKDWNHLKWFDQAETNLYLEFFDEFFLSVSNIFRKKFFSMIQNFVFGCDYFFRKFYGAISAWLGDPNADPWVLPNFWSCVLNAVIKNFCLTGDHGYFVFPFRKSLNVEFG